MSNRIINVESLLVFCFILNNQRNISIPMLHFNIISSYIYALNCCICIYLNIITIIIQLYGGMEICRRIVIVLCGILEAAQGLTAQQQLELLAKLEEANRKIEADAKNPVLQGHSRKGSDASQISVLSAASSSHDAEISTAASATGDEEDLWSVWGAIVANWEIEWKKRHDFIRDLVRQGIPIHFRGIVWQLLSGADSSREKKLYAAYIKANSACEKVIRRDVARTYPEHDFFKEKDGMGQEALFNVMKAYSLYDREVGYCQGSGFIVGLLLMQMPEEEAFAVLIQIMHKHRMREMYKPSMAELGLCMYQLENLVKDTLPDLNAHFQAQSFNTSIYASSWFLTLFTTTLSQPLACRVMDVFLSEGMQIIFKVALALLILGKEKLLSLDMENILKYMQKELPAKAESCPDAFMNLAYTVKINSKKLKKYEKDYLVIKTKEQSDTAVLRNLRQENRLLKQRVEMLEKESSALAEKLVRGQVDRAEGAEETFALAREVQALRQAHMETQQMLANAQEEIRSLTSLEENNSGQSTLEFTETVADPKQELARCLQKELVRARLQAAERAEVEKELNARIAELENENKQLRGRPVDHNVAHLQEELIAARLREAEAHLALKELRQRLTELTEEWNAHLQEHKQEPLPAAGPSNVVSDIMATPKKLLRAWDGRSDEMKKLSDQLITAKLNDAETTMELKELRLKIMHLEAQTQVSTNQLKRRDEEIRHLREVADQALERERVLLTKQKEAEHKYTDLETKYKYETVQARIRSVEAAQRIAELENKVSEYKVMNQVMAAEGELRGNDESERVRQLEDEIVTLKAEIVKFRKDTSVTGDRSDVRKLKFDSPDSDDDDGGVVDENLSFVA